MVKLRVRDLYDGLLLRCACDRATEYFEPGEVVVVRKDPDAQRHHFVVRSRKVGVDYFLWADNLSRFKVEDGPW